MLEAHINRRMWKQSVHERVEKYHLFAEFPNVTWTAGKWEQVKTS
jgi:hypothetical protein